MTLDPIQLRVLGALIEKEIATPENYPLSLNALVNACNQRSSRDPVLNLTEDEVRQAIHSLEELQLTAPVRDSRVPKYEHRIRTVDEERTRYLSQRFGKQWSDPHLYDLMIRSHQDENATAKIILEVMNGQS